MGQTLTSEMRTARPPLTRRASATTRVTERWQVFSRALVTGLVLELARKHLQGAANKMAEKFAATLRWYLSMCTLSYLSSVTPSSPP